MIALDAQAVRRMTLVEIRNPRDLGEDSPISQRLYRGETANTYRLRDPSRRHGPVGPLLTRLAGRPLGEHLLIACNSDRYATEVAVHGALPRTAFSLMLRGSAELRVPGRAAVTAAGARGAIFRAEPGLRLESGDASERFNLWVSDALIGRMLAAMLQEEPRAPLRFPGEIDWSRGGGPALLRLLAHLAEDLTAPGGMADSPVAIETFAELVADTILRRLPHGHAAALGRPTGAAAPRQLRRAEAFMEAEAHRALTLAEVAQAAGCSLRTLHEAFRRFRGTTPHGALQAMRLERVRAALVAEPQVPTAVLARRFGFTHVSRFSAAYTARFSETPAETRRRAPA
jgi:AraC-like DNA-binding protein